MSATAWPFGDLKPLTYGTILADPPWSFDLRSAAGEGKSAQAQYQCMPLEEIQALPVSHLARGDAVLAMWATFPMLQQAMATMEAWGFRYVTGGAWAKQSTTGRRWAFGTGYVYRSAAELWLIGKIGEPAQLSRSIRNLIAAPVRGHSRKPDQMHADLEALFEGPRCELFARQRRPGWDVFGNQTDKFSQPTTGE